ncbi:MAG: hypothetical protein JNL58_31820 [Planctomyces sp.]|nr:hypothetical protein [Planctomyces sp.]
MSSVPAAEPRQVSSHRLLSIDALRGFDMFWIASGENFVLALLARSEAPWAKTASRQLEHVAWEGFRFYDLIFPLFLFLAGVVIPFSMSRQQADGAAAWWRIGRRTVLLFLLGLLCNGLLEFDWKELRIAGVLQRIAVCYGITAAISLKTGWRTQLAVIIGILIAYCGILSFIPAPGSAAGDLSPQGNLAGYLDRNFLPGKILDEYYGYGDNEGLLSTLPSVATCLLGCLCGHWLLSSYRGWTKAGGLVLAGSFCLMAGTVWGNYFPIIKNLWTSSFVLVAGGWSLLLLAVFYAVIDVLRLQRWAFVFIVIGSNAITIYVVPSFIDFSRMSAWFLGGFAKMSGDWNSVVLSGGVIVLQWLFLYYLYRNRIFLRL